MAPRLAALIGPDELTVGRWVITKAPDWPAAFLEATREIAAYVGLSLD